MYILLHCFLSPLNEVNGQRTVQENIKHYPKEMATKSQVLSIQFLILLYQNDKFPYTSNCGIPTLSCT